MTLQAPIIESSAILMGFFPAVMYYLEVREPLKGAILKHTTVIISLLSLTIVLTLWNYPSFVIRGYAISVGYLFYTVVLIYLIPLSIYVVLFHIRQERIEGVIETVFYKPKNLFYYIGSNGNFYAFDPSTATHSIIASPPIKNGCPQICFYDTSMNVWNCYPSMDSKNHFVVDGKEIQG